jgi:hypothetical protein
MEARPRKPPDVVRPREGAALTRKREAGPGVTIPNRPGRSNKAASQAHSTSSKSTPRTRRARIPCDLRRLQVQGLLAAWLAIGIGPWKGAE